MTLFFHAFIMLSICYHLGQAYYLMSTVAGSGSSSPSSGDGGPATSARFSILYQVWVDSVGNLFIPDSSKYQLRKVDTVGIINAFIGSGTQSTSGNGGPALTVSLDGVVCSYGDTAGNIYISGSSYFIWFYNHTSGQVSRFAGNTPGGTGYSGDGGPATSAKISMPVGLFLSSNGILYFADVGNNVVRAIDTSTNIFTTIAGKSGASTLGDGGPATSAMMNPYGVWGNTAGVLYIGDTGYSRIRKVATDGIITTVAGTGNSNYNGDNIRATKAALQYPYNCQGDTLGNLYISDSSNNRVRMVSATTGNITTIAGDGWSNGANASVHVATAVDISPTMLQLDSLGNIYFSEGAYVRKLFVAPTAMPTVAPSIVPTVLPTVIPTIIPSTTPSLAPTESPSIVPSVVPTTAIPSVAPSVTPTESPSIVPSTNPSTLPTASPTVVPSFRPSLVNVTVDSSSRSQRLSDLHIFYATFFPAFFVVFLILPIVVYYLWKSNKEKKQLQYGEINVDDPAVIANGNVKKIVKVGKYYEWSL